MIIHLLKLVIICENWTNLGNCDDIEHPFGIFHEMEEYSTDSSKNVGWSSWSLELEPVVSQTQLVHSSRFSPIIDKNNMNNWDYESHWESTKVLDALLPKRMSTYLLVDHKTSTALMLVCSTNNRLWRGVQSPVASVETLNPKIWTITNANQSRHKFAVSYNW